MKQHTALYAALVVLALSATFFPASSFGAPPVINPGERHYFTKADGGARLCRSANGTLPDTVSCNNALFDKTTFNAANNFVRASVEDTPLTSFAAARIVTASVYNDFSIPGDSAHFVDAQITVTYDFFVALAAYSAYTASSSLSLIVEEITSSVPVFIANETFFSMERNGDQGFTDITGGEQIDYPRNEAYTMKIKLRRGHTYRVWFQAKSLAESDGLYVLAEGSGYWNRLMVDLDNDQVEQLAQHDQAIKNELNGIKDILATPLGRRPGFPNK
jgi:hypothetical protein